MCLKSDGFPDRVELLDYWRQRLRDAKMRYDFARNYSREVAEDYRSRLISETVEMYACRKAIGAEMFALAAYARTLRIVSDLALKGIIPAEDERSRVRGV